MGDFYVFVDAPDTGLYGNESPDSDCWIVVRLSSKPLSELEEIGRRVEIESAALLSQAKVEQEVSIARRILCAQEVEIEEFYDVKGSGSAGFSQQEQGVQLGLAGDVQRVTRRVILIQWVQ